MLHLGCSARSPGACSGFLSCLRIDKIGISRLTYEGNLQYIFTFLSPNASYAIQSDTMFESATLNQKQIGYPRPSSTLHSPLGGKR